MKHQVNMLIACVFMAMFSGSSAECPPMPDGMLRREEEEGQMDVKVMDVVPVVLFLKTVNV